MTSPQILKHAILAVILSTLAACGGGGGDSAEHSSSDTGETPGKTIPRGSSGDSATLDQTTYTGEKLAAFNALNAARSKVGLQPVKQNTRLDTAAQAHANYLVLNETTGHDENESEPGFTGTTSAERVTATGYTATSGEGVGGTLGYVISGDEATNQLIRAPYHRIPILSPMLADLGIGLADKTLSERTWSYSVFTYGYTSNAFPITQGHFVWPVDNATNIPIHMGGESPDPAPDLTYNQRGYPASITVNPNDTITVDIFKMNCAGEDLPSRIIVAGNDIHKRLPNNWAFLLTEVALPRHTVCSITFQGSSPALGKFNKTWSFTTEQ